MLENSAHDRTGASIGVSFIKRRLAEDTVLPMHPDQWWACAVSGVLFQSAAKSTMVLVYHWGGTAPLNHVLLALTPTLPCGMADSG